MDGSAPAPPSPSGTASFSAETHSWILVEDAPTPPEGLTPAASHETVGDAARREPTASSCSDTADAAEGDEDEAHTPSTPPAEEDELISALAVSEVLASTWPLPLTTSSGMMVKAAGAACDASDAAAGEAEGQLAASCGADRAPVSFDLGPLDLDPVFCSAPAKQLLLDGGALEKARQQLFRRPLVMMAVLIASHAAALLIGVYIGQQLSAPPAPEESTATFGNGTYLARRFSSGPTGMHARLCAA